MARPALEYQGYASRARQPGAGRSGVLAQDEWRRIAGFRVVMSWSPAGYATLPGAAGSLRSRLAGLAGVLLILAGTLTVAAVLITQVHAPQPSRAAAGDLGPRVRGPWLRRSDPVAVTIPSIGVRSRLLHLGVTRSGAIQVPSLTTRAGDAAWFRYSVTPGQVGVSVIEGHVDNYLGPAVFFRLGALRPGDHVDVRLADGITAVFRVNGVRQYLKARYPARVIYRPTNYAALRLITCGGAFDYQTGHYLSSTVVFASLTSARRH
jgi:hypothetical protein